MLPMWMRKERPLRPAGRRVGGHCRNPWLSDFATDTGGRAVVRRTADRLSAGSRGCGRVIGTVGASDCARPEDRALSCCGALLVGWLCQLAVRGLVGVGGSFRRRASRSVPPVAARMSPSVPAAPMPASPQ